MQDNSGNVLILLGPTGVGKSEIGLRLAFDLKIPIVSADSRQIYKNMQIGTCCPTKEEQSKVVHYFIETKNVDEEYNAGMYEQECTNLLNKLNKKIPSKPFFAILIGGSMLYIDAVCYGLDSIPKVPLEIKHQCEKEYQKKGLTWLQNQVREKDSQYWERVDQQNPARLLHCLEVTSATGIPYSHFRKQSPDKKTSNQPWKYTKVGLYRDRDSLYQRINTRVDKMIENGLVQEAKKLYTTLKNSPYRPNSLNTVGYKELFAYFENKLTLAQTISLIKQNTRHYAKRQITWWRKQNDIHWIELNETYEKIKTDIINLANN